MADLSYEAYARSSAKKVSAPVPDAKTGRDLSYDSYLKQQERPGLLERFANRAEVSAERMGANLLDLGGKVVSAMSPAGEDIGEGGSAPRAPSRAEKAAASLRKYATEKEAKVPEAQGIMENIASGAGYILPDIASTVVGGTALRGLGLAGKASTATGLAGSATRAAQGAAAAAPFTTVPRALVGEKGESPTEMLTGTTNPLFKLAGDVAIDVAGGTALDFLTSGGARAAAKSFGKKMGTTESASDAIIREAKGKVQEAPVEIKPVDKLDKVSAGIERKPPFAGAVDAEDYMNISRFSDDPNVQQRLLNATEEAVRQTTMDLRAPANMTINGTRFRKGDLLDRESLDHVRAAAAADYGIDPADVATRTANGERIGRVDMLRVKTAIDGVLEDENQLLLRISDPNKYTADEIATAKIALERVQKERDVLINTFTKQGTETARDLNAMKIGALKSGDPTVWAVRLQQLAKRPLTDSEKIATRIAADNKDIDGLISLAQQVQKSTWQEKVATWVKAGMLMSPKTHIANILGNTTMQGLESAKDIPAAVFDKLLSIQTGIRTKDFNAAASAKSSLRGAVESKKAVMRALRGQKDLSAGLDGVREVTYDSAIANLITKGVFRSLGAADEFFKSVSFARSIDEQARIIAKAERLSGDALAERVAQLRSAPTDEMAMRAGSDAAIATFQDDTWLSKGALGLRRWAGLPGEIMFPFAKTPANIATRITEYGPLGFIKELGDLNRVINSGTPNYTLQKKVVEGLGRATLGGAAISLGYLAAKNGRMTGFFPSNPRERSAWEVSGKMEGSIKVNGKWVQVNKLSPLGNLLQVGAAMHDLEGNTETGALKALFGNLTSPLRSVSELPMVANVQDLVEAVGKAGSDETWDATARIMGRVGQGFIPGSGLVRSIAQATDPVIRETKSPSVLEAAKQNIMAGVPGLSKMLPERLDPLGRTQVRDLGPVGSIFSPLAVRESLTTDPVRAELERTNAVVTPVKRRKDETPSGFEERKRFTGETVNRVVAAIINSQRYQQMGNTDPSAARQALEGAGIQTENISDDRIRSRLQGAMIERVIDRAKSAIYRAQPKTAQQRTAEFAKSITRR